MAQTVVVKLMYDVETFEEDLERLVVKTTSRALTWSRTTSTSVERVEAELAFEVRLTESDLVALATERFEEGNLDVSVEEHASGVSVSFETPTEGDVLVDAAMNQAGLGYEGFEDYEVFCVDDDPEPHF